MNTIEEAIKTLIEKAAAETDSGNAMRYAQAAQNAANALILLHNMKKPG